MIGNEDTKWIFDDFKELLYMDNFLGFWFSLRMFIFLEKYIEMFTEEIKWCLGFASKWYKRVG